MPKFKIVRPYINAGLKFSKKLAVLASIEEAIEKAKELSLVYEGDLMLVRRGAKTLYFVRKDIVRQNV